MDEYLDYIDSYSYNKIWSELSHKDRQVLYALANSDEGNVSDVKTELGISSNELSPYRDRLIKRGIVNGDERGILRFTLPYFKEYVLNNYI